MKVSNIKWKFKHYISTMAICGSYMFKFDDRKDMKNDKKKNPTYLLALIVKESKISVE